MHSVRNKFFAAYGFWQWGEGFQTVLFTWYMTIHLGMSATEIGFYQALVLSPFLIVALLGGVLTDRFGAGACYVLSTLVFSVILLGYGLLDHTHGYVPALFFAYCILAGIVSAISNPAIDSFIPEATPMRAQDNALLAANVHNIAKMTGTVTGLALPFLLATGGFIANGVLMLISALTLNRHLRNGGAVPPRGQHRPGWTLPRVVQHFRSCPENLDILLSSALLGFIIVPAGYILMPLILRENFPQFGNWIALMNISSWIGAIVLTSLAARLSPRIHNPGRAALFIWGLYALGLTAANLAGQFALFCVVALCLGGVKVAKALVYGKYLYNAPNEDRGVLVAIDQTAFWGLATMGSMVLGATVDLIGLTQTITAVSVMVVSGVLLLASRGHLLRMSPA